MPLKAAGFIGLCLLLSVLLMGRTEAAGRVEAVQVEVTALHSLPALAKNRMEKSVEAIALQLLMGREIAELQAQKARDESLIVEVFDKVLIGYTVTGAVIEPGETASVRVMLAPWDATIEKVVPAIAVEGMPDMVEKLVRQDAAGLGEVFQKALLGLPVAAGEWTTGLIRQEVRKYLEQHLPEFRADFEVYPGRETRAEIVLYPRLPVVRTVDLSMRSDTIPNMTLLSHRGEVQKKCDELVGVPVGFVSRHKAALEEEFIREMDEKGGLSRWKLTTRAEIRPGENTQVMSRSDTDSYRVRLEGWLDVGRRSDQGRNRDITLRLHAGAMLSRKDEVFTLLDVYPEKPDWGWQLGYGRSLSSKGRAEVRYDLRDSQWIMAASQQLARRWLLRYEYRWGGRIWETALRYQLHDFMALEYVVDRHDNWLRVIGYF
ncbi:MAG: acylphosphatase [Selenomonas ruminantium]|nr:acylphosphatase [Selenomonas ruminantium]